MNATCRTTTRPKGEQNTMRNPWRSLVSNGQRPTAHSDADEWPPSRRRCGTPSWVGRRAVDCVGACEEQSVPQRPTQRGKRSMNVYECLCLLHAARGAKPSFWKAESLQPPTSSHRKVCSRMVWLREYSPPQWSGASFLSFSPCALVVLAKRAALFPKPTMSACRKAPMCLE